MNDNVIGSIILEGASTTEDVVLTNTNSRRVTALVTLQDLGVENRNHRIYGEADMRPEVEGPRIKELIEHGEMKGEDGHPLSEDLVRQQTIDPKLVCVKYTKIWIEKNLIKATCMGTNNAYGAEFDQDLRDGDRPAFSLRALGSIQNINGKAHVKDIKIITWDRVIYPSHKAAYTEKIISESCVINGKEQVMENQVVVPFNDPGTIINITKENTMEVLNRLQRESANLSRIVEVFDGLYDNISLINENTLCMTSRFGEKIFVNLEKHVHNLIMDYACK